MEKSSERTLIILKPDAVQRNLLGDIITRFERKGLKMVGLKMMRLDDVILTEHYVHLKDKPFFDGLKKFMKESPVVVACLEGVDSIKVVRTLCGPTSGREAAPGTIRGDFSISMSSNIVHASDSEKAAKEEVDRFFEDKELFSYNRCDSHIIYASDEL